MAKSKPQKQKNKFGGTKMPDKKKKKARKS